MSALNAGLVKAYLAISSSDSPLLSAVSAAYGPNVNSEVRATGLGTLVFKFNPKEYSISKSANWHGNTKAASTTKAPEAEYLGPNPRTLTLEIFLDESDSTTGDVSKDIDVLMGCCTVLPGADPPRPPTVVFGWGTNVSFKAYVEQVQAHFTQFRAEGTPFRATANITLKELPEVNKPTNPSSGTPVIHKVRTVTAGDTLASIAYQEYRNPSRWRAIAAANDIDDPMRVPTGTTLVIPPPREAAEQS